MPLRLLNQPPSSAEAALVFDNISELAGRGGAVVINGPADELVTDELEYWERFVDSAYREGDENGELIGRAIYAEIYRLEIGGAAVKLALEQVDDVEQVDRVLAEYILWQQKLVALMGLTQVVRTLETEDKARHHDEGLPDPDIFGITYETEHYKSIGVHVDDAFLERLGIAPVEVGKEVWYEGETVYLRLQKPAHIPLDVLQAANEDREVPVRRDQLTSIAGRVKRAEFERRKV